MTELQMSETKKAGLEKHLLSEASGKLFAAKRHLEEAERDRFINFQREIEKARKAIDDAEQLWNETYKL